MKARDKVSPFIAPSCREMRDSEVKPGRENELVAASERFATTLRTAAAETGPRESRSTCFLRSEHLLWTTTFESPWHRHIGRTSPSTMH